MNFLFLCVLSLLCVICNRRHVSEGSESFSERELFAWQKRIVGVVDMADALQKRNTALEDENAALKAEIAELKEQLVGGKPGSSWKTFNLLNPLSRAEVKKKTAEQINKNKVKDEKKHIDLLMTAAKEGKNRDVEKLLEEGVPVDAPASWEFGETALMVAAKWGHTLTVELLIANRADIDRRDDNGETALYKAAEWGRNETAMTLVHRGAGLDKPCKRSKNTPLMVAGKVGHTKICEMLIKEGASLKVLNSMGQDPIEVTRTAGQEDTAKAMEKARDKRRKSKKIDPTAL